MTSGARREPPVAVARAVDRARTGLVDLERLPDAELTRQKEEFARLRDRAAREHDTPP